MIDSFYKNSNESSVGLLCACLDAYYLNSVVIMVCMFKYFSLKIVRRLWALPYSFKIFAFTVPAQSYFLLKIKRQKTEN